MGNNVTATPGELRDRRHVSRIAQHPNRGGLVVDCSAAKAAAVLTQLAN